MPSKGSQGKEDEIFSIISFIIHSLIVHREGPKYNQFLSNLRQESMNFRTLNKMKHFTPSNNLPIENQQCQHGISLFHRNEEAIHALSQQSF